MRTSLTFTDCRWSMHTFIKSKTSHKQHRDILRNLTGDIRFIRNTLFRTTFITGKASGKLQESIRRESTLHGDILQVAVPDEYR